MALALKRWKSLSGSLSDLSLTRAGGSNSVLEGLGFRDGEAVLVAAAAAAEWQNLRAGRRESMIRERVDDHAQRLR